MCSITVELGCSYNVRKLETMQSTHTVTYWNTNLVLGVVLNGKKWVGRLSRTFFHQQKKAITSLLPLNALGVGRAYSTFQFQDIRLIKFAIYYSTQYTVPWGWGHVLCSRVRTVPSTKYSEFHFRLRQDPFFRLPGVWLVLEYTFF